MTIPPRPLPLQTLLPPNANELERAAEASLKPDELPVNIRDLINPDTCPEPLLPWLAWSLSIDNWNAAWPVGIKRQRIRTTIAIARRKGSTRSVREAVASFGGHIAIREWHEKTPPGPVHTFELVLNLSGDDGAPVEAAYVDAVIAEVNRTKPLRSHFTFTQGVEASASIGVFAAARPAVYARLDFAA